MVDVTLVAKDSQSCPKCKICLSENHVCVSCECDNEHTGLKIIPTGKPVHPMDLPFDH